MSYRDPILTKLIALFNAEGPAVLKNRYYQGDPLIVPKSALPGVFISKDRTNISGASTAEDQVIMPVVVNVVLDLTRDFNQAFDNIGSASTLYGLIEGRDDDYQLKADSLLYILRKHKALDTQLWINMSEDLEAEYGVGVEKRGTGIYTMEAVVRLTLTHHQLRPGLS